MDGKFVNDDATAHREARLAFRKIVETSEDWDQFRRLEAEYGFQKAIELCSNESWIDTLKTILAVKDEDGDRVFHDQVRKLLDDPSELESLLEGPPPRMQVAVETERHGVFQVGAAAVHGRMPNPFTGSHDIIDVDHSVNVYDGGEAWEPRGVRVPYASRTVLIRECQCSNCNALLPIRLDTGSGTCACGDTVLVDETKRIRMAEADGGLKFENIVDERWKDRDGKARKVFSLHFEVAPDGEPLEETMARAGVFRHWFSPVTRRDEGQLVRGFLQGVLKEFYHAYDQRRAKLDELLKTEQAQSDGLSRLTVECEQLVSRIWDVRKVISGYMTACRVAGGMEDTWVRERDWKKGHWVLSRDIPVYFQHVALPLSIDSAPQHVILFSPMAGSEMTESAKQRVADSRARYKAQRLVDRNGSAF